ncbi:ubiquitin carboxyl-terminal hydrolase [bacterium]|nr:ubiquitin carboxyl-terminal hydrolase [bacterium]NDC93947.1 ubiquitin carboxyl-terminal hydrolase [bacterium]NDD83442.1 ubiquitin carboxyl-terminal hydrolase [bacterium]NDG29067.1 ubiquitin carboxyl-terminal hydrolase [bacterium]
MYEYDFHKHHQLVLSKEKYMKRGLCGLVNMGNTCFLNSILQCLSHTLKLTDYFLSGEASASNRHNHHRGKEYYLVMSYHHLLINIWEKNQVLRPKSFFENLCKFKPKYYKHQQQDSHECLMFILEILHKGLCYAVDVDIKGKIKTRTDQLMKRSLEQFKAFYEKEFSFIIQTFNGMFRVEIRCNHCDYTDDVFEPFNCISLDLPNKKGVTLADCLDASLCEKEHIDTFTCEKCKRSGCNKTTELWTVPDYLVVHFKRFKREPNGFTKIETHIEFPLDDIDLTRFVSKDRDDPNNYIYSCYAINYHNGDLDGGHYFSTCKNLDDHWYMFNDGNVSKVPDTQMLTKNAYILFLSRKMTKSC